jgi:hypothetical protein
MTDDGLAAAPNPSSVICHPSSVIRHPSSVIQKSKSPVSGAFAMFNPSAMNKLPLVFLNGINPNRISKSYCDWCALGGE